MLLQLLGKEVSPGYLHLLLHCVARYFYHLNQRNQGPRASRIGEVVVQWSGKSHRVREQRDDSITSILSRSAAGIALLVLAVAINNTCERSKGMLR